MSLIEGHISAQKHLNDHFSTLITKIGWAGNCYKNVLAMYPPVKRQQILMKLSADFVMSTGSLCGVWTPKRELEIIISI